jgi:Asp-tRNA(Asn)/Glu-tRNA(Gln) amidotransferase A subunit family amidase
LAKGISLVVEVAAESEDAARRAIAWARQLNPQLRAFVEIFERAAKAQSGPLGGMPFAVKDLLDVAGRAPTLGLARAPGAIPANTAPVVETLRALGGRLIGFTAMTPLAYEPSGANALRGRPVNPWSADHICGGSSSGSAVAVAAGIVPVALGSDTGGSLRIPAQCCGVTAWKPTRDLVPLGGAMALAPSLDTIGFLARGAADLIAIAEAFSGANGGSPITRLAVARDVIGDCDRCIDRGVGNVEMALQAQGIHLGETRLAALIAACDAPVMTLMQSEAARAHQALIATGGLPATLATRLGKGQSIDDAQLGEARRLLAELAHDALDAAFDAADAILLPVMRIRTPTVAVCEPGSLTFSARTLYELSALTRWVNGLGLPAIAIPCGFDHDGLPMAVQIVGRPNRDVALLKFAAALQSRTDWHGRTPAGIAQPTGEFA